MDAFHSFLSRKLFEHVISNEKSAFHSDDYSKQSQNLSESSVDRIFSYSYKEQLLNEVSEEYDNLLYEDSEVEQVFNLYKIASRQERGFVRDANGEEVRVEELQELTEIVDRHLGGERR